MKIRKDAWVIADTHFNHSNIILYCNRPFKSASEMNDVLVVNWNNRIGKDDQVIFLGDFALGSAEIVRHFFNQLNGEKYMIMGNHDKNHSEQWWLDIGFKGVSRYPVIYDNYWIFSHEPIDWVSERLPVVNICGHIHEKTHYNLDNHHYVVSVEQTGYHPVRLSDIMEICIKRNGDYCD